MAKKKKTKNTTTAVATVAPTGLAVTRSGSIITFSWTIGDADYNAGQEFYYDINGVRQITGPLPGGMTSYSIPVDLNSPLIYLSFGVRGQRAPYSVTTKNKKTSKTTSYTPIMSAWNAVTTWVSIPSAPLVSFALSNDGENKGSFSWNIPNVSTDGWIIFTRYEWQSIIVNKHNSKQPPASGWERAESGSGFTDSGTWTKEEDSSLFNDPDYSYTRWFRVRSVGPAGATPWVYCYHTYSLPREARDLTSQVTKRSNANGYTCVTTWVAPESFTYPIESCIVQYAIATPVTSSSVITDDGITTRVVEWNCPETNWTSAGTIADNMDNDPLNSNMSISSQNFSFAFPIDNSIDEDKVVYTRVITKHDGHEIASEGVIADGGLGVLPKATGITIAANPSTCRVNIIANNNSNITSSFIAIYFRTEEEHNTYTCIGILPKEQSNITVQCPNWGDQGISIGLQPLLADYSPANANQDGVTEYTISNIKMIASEIQWDEGRVPMPPKSVECSAPNSSTIRVVWDWSWSEANQTELSWADHEDAWESTNEPQSYLVNDMFAGQWNISGVSVGTWYVRARLIKKTEDSTLYGLWSDTKTVKLSSAPAIPSLILSEDVIAPDGEVTCYWAYVTTDGTSQLQADICEATLDPETGEFSYSSPFTKSDTSQNKILYAQDWGWQAGEEHYLAVRVISASGEQSQGWSTPVKLTIAEPPSVDIVSVTNVVEDQVTGAKSLIELPFTVTINGAGLDGTITIAIVRASAFHMRRPDDSSMDGYEGETVYLKSFVGDGSFEIKQEDLIGYLDDGAFYNLIVTVKDSLKQTATNSDNPYQFRVNWTHQASTPLGTVEIDNDYDIAVLTPLLPDGITAENGDSCDIYRLSVDAPQLIYKGAEFGEKYVDPYPTIGDHGGYRFVYVTYNGDYTTENKTLAWYNTNESENEILDTFTTIINYGENRVSLPYNLSLNNKWTKDVQITSYLGGHVQGDWNPIVTRTGTITSVGIVSNEYGTEEDVEVIEAVRRLAVYSGVCHVRTPDGSSFSANVNVSEDRENRMINKLANYSLEISQVDSQSLDGITYAEWQRQIEEDEEEDEE